ncbi:MAG: hypothetical protein M1829_002208 [Trizodia sp. TS-e1964]|nr:MAG: hypothetical protein M1829_002208 [Trizodia sp. TS-e1964]
MYLLRDSPIVEHFVAESHALAVIEAQAYVDRLRLEGRAMPSPPLGQEWSPLDTLAEASRQTDISERPYHPFVLQQPALDAAMIAEVGFNLNFAEQWTPSNPPLSFEERARQLKQRGASKLPTTPCSSGSVLPPIQPLNTFTDPQKTLPHLSKLSLPISADPAARYSLLFPTNSAAPGEHRAVLPRPGLPLEPELEPRVKSMAGFPSGYFHPRQPPMQQALPDPCNSLSQLDPTNHASQPAVSGAHYTASDQLAIATPPVPTAIGVLDNDSFTVAAGPPKPKHRSKFSPTRRKEVQEVRKRGACMRCRMLKKPVSPTSPHIIFLQAIILTMAKCTGEVPCGTCKSIESARLWKQPCLRTRIADELELYSAGLHAKIASQEVDTVRRRVNFKSVQSCIEVTHHSDSFIYISFNALEGTTEEVDENGNRTYKTELKLLDDGNDMPIKLEGYLQEMAQTFYEREFSDFMKPTLNVAAQLSHQKKDLLLNRVLELWAVNHVLSDSEMSWQTFERLSTSADGSIRRPINKETDERSYNLLCNQLRCAAEKRASYISRIVMNELEKRLLQRTQGGWFETFLVAILLLNCVERTSWYFETWNKEQWDSKWPLEQNPRYYYGQGERFAEMLHMLVRIRNLPPKTYEGENGLLASNTDDSSKYYFDIIALSSEKLKAREFAEFDPNNSRSLELKYCSKLLLPEPKEKKKKK